MKNLECAIEAIEKAEDIGESTLFVMDEDGNLCANCGLGHIYAHCIDDPNTRFQLSNTSRRLGLYTINPDEAYIELCEFLGLGTKAELKQRAEMSDSLTVATLARSLLKLLWYKNDFTARSMRKQVWLDQLEYMKERGHET